MMFATKPVHTMAIIGARTQQLTTQMARPNFVSASPRVKIRSEKPEPNIAAKAT